MAANIIVWNIYFALVAILAALILHAQSMHAQSTHAKSAKKDFLRYILYGSFGAIFAGFFFDPLSVHLGYYEFNLPFTVLGVPWAVIAAEFFSVIITIWVFEAILAKTKAEVN
ncbi:MAG: hypothetical protein NUV67_04500 [archaeon]|nr:hypothetical protein [archaeon]